jgi:ABC-type lipopolysaccharide export system ATPase subunit
VAQLGISRTFQNLQMFFNMSVLDNVKVGCHLRTNSRLWSAALRLPGTRREERWAEQWACEALHFCDLDEYLHSAADALPYGVLKRLEIARALASQPAFVLLDEPFAGVDPISVLDIQRIIKHLCARDIGVLITDHNVRETLGICGRAYILSDGSLIASGTPEEILENQHVREVYLGQEFKL